MKLLPLLRLKLLRLPLPPLLLLVGVMGGCCSLQGEAMGGIQPGLKEGIRRPGQLVDIYEYVGRWLVRLGAGGRHAALSKCSVAR